VQPVARTLLRERAYLAIRDAIVRGELAPGVPVRDVDLAGELGLSRAPVRDALGRLADEGLVETKPQSYTRVTELTSAAVTDALAVVGVLHELVTRTAVPELTGAEVAAMRAANRRFAAAIERGDVDAALSADDALHGVLVDVAGNGAAAATIARYTPLIRRLERVRFSAGSARLSVAAHEELIAACAAGEVAAAAACSARIWRSLAH
jgi:DNA-binding GntR family transcriptional regulator